MKAKMPPKAATDAFSLYIHYPWCIQKCPYCDFNSYTQPKEDVQISYVNALIQDIDQIAMLASDRPLQSVFFGGGTPSLMSGASVERMMQTVRKRFNCMDAMETTLEINPASMLYDTLSRYSASGIQRLSICGQSFHKDHLKTLGRIHDPESIHNTYFAAQKAGIERINIDIMYHLPGQNQEQALADIDLVIQLLPEHISWYELTYEPNTVFAKTKPKRLDSDQAFDMAVSGQNRLSGGGYRRYEVSAYTRGQPCLHNMNYWTFGDYLGVGAGAHSKWTVQGSCSRWQKTKSPFGYMRQPTKHLYTRRIQGDELIFEYMLGRLRLPMTITSTEFHERTCLDFSQVQKKVEASQYADFFEYTPTSLRVTTRGQWFLNDCVSAFL